MLNKIMDRDKNLAGANILVTGGAGFIGSNICDYLITCRAKVRCFDNFSTGSKRNIIHLTKNKNFTLIEKDIRNLKDCNEAALNVDYILHQAALGSVPRSINDPLTTNDVNINGFLNILVAARDNHVKKVVYAASSSTYGDSKDLPKIENKIGEPLSPYGITKYVNELYASVFKKNYNLDTIGLRYFNVFGPRQDANGAYAAAIPLFIKSILRDTRPTINGDGENSRDFTFVANVVQANILAIFAKKESNNQIYNVACGKRKSLNELFEAIKKNAEDLGVNCRKLKPVFGQSRSGDIPHSLASLEKARKLLGYEPLVQFDEGIKQTIRWHLNN